MPYVSISVVDMARLLWVQVQFLRDGSWTNLQLPSLDCLEGTELFRLQHENIGNELVCIN